MRVALISLLLLHSVACLAQDFQPGYIVSRENDTIRGQVNYQTKSNNYKQCDFRTPDTETKYKPDQIRGYGWEDKDYISGIVANHFVEVLVSSELSLYRFEEDFFMKKQDQIVELKRPVKTRVVKGVEKYDGTQGNLIKYQEDKDWLHKIAYLVSDCDQDLSRKLESIKFNAKDLTAITNKYNECQGAEQVEKKQGPWYRIQMGLSAGVVNSKINLSEKDNIHQAFRHLNDSYTSTDPYVGLLFEISAPRLSNRVSFQIEAQLFKTHYSGSKPIDYGHYQEFHQTSLEFTTLSLPFALKYTIPAGSNAFHLYLGGSYDQFFSPESTSQTDFTRDGEVTTSYGEAFDIRKNALGGWAGVGYSRHIKGISAGVRGSYHLISNMGDKHPASENAVKANGNRLVVSLILQQRK